MNSYIFKYVASKNFYQELEKIQNDDEIESQIDKQLNKDEELCLISNEPLSKYYITLPCNHKFNYLPLLYAIIENSQVKYNLTKNQIKCPYCKQIQTCKVLPYVPFLESKKYKNINWPQKNLIQTSNTSKTCSYAYKSGKNKGKCCGAKCYWEHCHNHLKYLEKTNKCVNSDPDESYLKNINIETIQSDELNKMTVITLRKLAKINNKKNYSRLKKANLILLLKSEESQK